MAEKNIRIKVKNALGSYDILYPESKIELIKGLQEALNAKVSSTEGKGLSTNDYTNEDKVKLTGIQAGAEVNKVNSVAGKIGDVTLSKSDVGLGNVENKSSEMIRSEITINDILLSLGFTPEDIAKKGVANGYAGLDANGKLPISVIPDLNLSNSYIVNTPEERLALVDLKNTDRCYELTTGDSYIYDGVEWRVLAEADWKNVNLQWLNIIGGPTSTPTDIDEAVTKKHNHTNKTVLDKITETEVGTSYDLSKFVTQENLQAHKIAADNVTEGDTKKFVSNTQISLWNSKAKIEMGTIEPVGSAEGDFWFEEVII